MITNNLKYLFNSIILVTTLVGCNYHLKGWNNSITKCNENVFIKFSNVDFDLKSMLNSKLQSNEINEVQNYKEADITIEILNTMSSEKLLNILGGASYNSYLITYTVYYKLTTKSMHTSNAKVQTISINQTYTTNATQVLSDNLKKQLIYQNMKAQIADNITSKVITICNSNNININPKAL